MKTLVIDIERTVTERKRVAVLVPDIFPDPPDAPLPWQCVAAQIQTLESDVSTDWSPKGRQPVRSDWVLVTDAGYVGPDVPPAGYRLRGGTVRSA